MQARSVVPLCLVLCVASLAGGAQAFWDQGHMLIGAIATTYLNASGDLGPLLQVLQTPDGISGFDGFHDIVDSAIWMDQIKCTSAAPYCPLPTQPSFSGFNNWHYGGKCIAVNYYPETFNTCPGTDRLDEGLLLSSLSDTIASFSTTKSISTAAMQVRIIAHLMGDLHQPLHNSGSAFDYNFPMGDTGGNGRRFDPGCEYSNMHALWDSAANLWTINWNPNTYSQLYPQLMQNASDMIASGVGMPDALNYASVANMSYSQFVNAMKGDYGLFARTIAVFSDYAKNTAYRSGINLNPKVPGGTLECPGASYKAMTQAASMQNVGLAGYRMAIVLSQVSKQIVKQGILNMTAAAYAVPEWEETPAALLRDFVQF